MAVNAVEASHAGTERRPLQPGAWLAKREHAKAGTVLVVLNQPIHNEEHFARAWKYCERHVFVDGAARHAKALNLVPDAAVGDADSIDEASLAYLERQGVGFVRDPDKYASDFEKAVKLCRQTWPEANDIYAFGALGGRVDHSWKSLLMLGRTREQDYQLYLLSEQSVTMLVRGAAYISTPRELLGISCGVAPCEGSTQLTMRGFEWDVEEWETSFETQLSTSNHIMQDTVFVAGNKPVFFTAEIRSVAADGG